MKDGWSRASCSSRDRAGSPGGRYGRPARRPGAVSDRVVGLLNAAAFLSLAAALVLL